MLRLDACIDPEHKEASPMYMNSPNHTGTLASLKFDNRFVRELPADPLKHNSRRQVSGACYSLVSPTPVSAPQLVAWSREVAEALGLSEEACQSREFVNVFSGNALVAGMEPFAMCYGGHQFGNWAGQLGDGRAINLGEVVNSGNQRWVIQLKGSGPTPYSRSRTAWQYCVPPYANFSAARPCSTWVFQRRVPLALF